MMKSKPLAFSPGSITAYFQITRDKVTGLPHSTGLSINIREGVTASLREEKTNKTFLNGNPIEIPTVTTVVQQLSPSPIHLSLETPLPLGAGFGLSAASALSSALAVNAFFGLKRTEKDLETVSFLAEVEHKTGVGDVAAQIEGGVVYRHTEDPKRISLPVEVPDFYCSVYGAIETRAILQSPEALAKVNQAGQKAILLMEQRLPQISWFDLCEVSWGFSQESGLLTPEVAKAVRKIREQGGAGFMIMIGNSLVSTIPDDNGKQVWKTNIDQQGARLL
ncbi:MAG: hypothetical protein HYS22_07145 [Deltaproteobacteria bacterium]|nr:hypothetical protein [Deltaproteobacteria bacterium]